MADPKPITPFFSTDERFTPQPSDQQERCECDAELTKEEIESGKCSWCGGRVLP